MYATLAHNPSATINEVLSDIVAVATGETVVSNLLSTSLVSSAINATVPAGWTLHDDVSATEKVITAAITDDPTRSKFIRFYVSGSEIQCQFYKSWDNVAHTGVVYQQYVWGGSASGTTKSVASIDATFGTVTCISASAAHFASTHLYNNEQTSYHPVIITEHNRESPWDTVANGYIPIATLWGDTGNNGTWTTSHQSWNFPEGPISDTLDWDYSSGYDSRGVAGLNTVGMRPEAAQMESCLNIPQRMLDVNKQEMIPLQPIRITGYDGYHIGGNISTKCNMYIVGNLNAGWNSKIISGGVEYRVWPILDTSESTQDQLYLAVKI